MALITAWEVIRYSPAGDKYPTTHICDNIRQVEEDFINRCFGEDWMAYLELHKNAYPDPEPALWNPATVYAIGDYVIRTPCLYKSLTALNTNHKPESDLVNWEKFEKFDTDCLNDLWTGYLRGYLAYVLYAESILDTTFITGAGGLTIRANSEREGAGIRQGKETEIGSLKLNVMDKAVTIKENMIRWLKNNRTTCSGFPSTIVCLGDCGPAQKEGRHRIALRSRTGWY